MREPDPNGFPKVYRKICESVSLGFVLKRCQRLCTGTLDENEIVVFLDKYCAGFGERERVKQCQACLVDIPQALFGSRVRRLCRHHQWLDQDLRTFIGHPPKIPPDHVGLLTFFQLGYVTARNEATPAVERLRG